MKIFLPLICYNHTANTEYMMSIMRFSMFCLHNNINLVLYPIFFDSLITRARNSAVAHFMADPSFTHLLFIDGDIEFQPEDVIAMLQVDKPVVTVGYAQKWIHMDPFIAQQANPLELSSFSSVHLADKRAPAAKLMEAEYATTGFLLIKRGVIQQMIEAYPERRYMNDVDGYRAQEATPYFYNLFAVEVHPETRRYESEDYGFSRLWRSLGGKIYVITDITLKHHGWFGYQSNLYRQLVLAQNTKAT